MPYADRAFNDECAPLFGALRREGHRIPRDGACDSSNHGSS
jgi:hypothetical protein